jgi:hypothetical protein
MFFVSPGSGRFWQICERKIMREISAIRGKNNFTLQRLCEIFILIKSLKEKLCAFASLWL